MYLVLCFLYIFFAIVLGTYLGLELVSVRKADRIARTILKGGGPTLQSIEPDSPVVEGDAATPNYFATK